MKTLRVLSWLGLLGLLLVTGCQSSKPGSESHAALEITGQPVDKIWTTTVVVFAEQGYRLRTNSATQLIFDRPASSAEKFKYGDWMNEGMAMQIKVRLQETSSTTCLMRADAFVVQDPTDPNFRHERRLSLTSGKPYRKLLEAVQHRLEGSPPN
jgi:hypothetical protein